MNDDPRLDPLLDVMLAMARHDFSKRAPVEGQGTLDAFAEGLNMLAEELEHTVASRRELEAANAQLVETGRLAAVGMLAAGVAHEVNNPAAWVQLALGLVRRESASLRRRLESDSPVDRAAALEELGRIDSLLADCIDGMQRITTVVGDLRLVSRASGEGSSAEPLELPQIVASCCRLASHQLEGMDVRILDESAPPVFANRGRVSQIVTNLVVNAAQAMRARPDADPKAITIVTTTAHEGALIAVEDSGPGIPEELVPRVFEPFFTTKPGREGMGLGLTIVAQIAASYGGFARVVPPRDLPGARIEVWLPASDVAMETSSPLLRVP